MKDIKLYTAEEGLRIMKKIARNDWDYTDERKEEEAEVSRWYKLRAEGKETPVIMSKYAYQEIYNEEC